MGLLDEVIDGEKLMDRAHEVALREGIKIAPGPWGSIKVSNFSASYQRGEAEHGRSEERLICQEQSYRSYILASQSDRPIMFPHQEAKAFWKRVGGAKL